MPIVIVCSSCGLQGRVPDGFAEPQVQCPRCGTWLLVAAPDSAPPAQPPMPATAASNSHPLDEFFARVAAQSDAAPPLAAAPPPVAAAPPIPPAPLAPQGNGIQYQAEREWLQEERQRLETYMAKHFGLLKQQREEFAGWRTQVEETLVAREQEVNRRQRQVAAQEEAQARREAELTEQEAGLERQKAEPIIAAEEELKALQAAIGQARQETEQLREIHEQLQTDAERLQQESLRAQNDLASLEATIQERRQLMEQEQSKWHSQWQHLERRQVALTKAEEMVQRRQAEVKGLEKQIYLELERQEQRLGLERKQLEFSKLELVSAVDEKDILRRKIAQLSRELENRVKSEQPDPEKEALRQKVAVLSREVERLREQNAARQGATPAPATRAAATPSSPATPRPTATPAPQAPPRQAVPPAPAPQQRPPQPRRRN
jgi:hypothetical protein